MARERLYGRQPVREALRAGRRRFFSLTISKNLTKSPEVAEILSLAGKAGVPIDAVPRNRLEALAGSPHHQGVVLETSGYPYVPAGEVIDSASRESLFLVLDHLQDPQNLGTLLRTSEAVGVSGVFVPDRRAASITPAVSKASAGAVEHLKIAMVGNVRRTLDDLKDAGVWIVGLEKVPEAVRYDARTWDLPLAVVVGSEGKGMSRIVRETCDWLVYLPMKGRIDSLNAAVSGSVFLYAVMHEFL